MNGSALEIIKGNEGFREKVYTCTAGKLTIGYGLNLEDRGVRPDEAEFIAKNIISEISAELKRERLIGRGNGEVREAVLIDMAYNLGIEGLYKFKKMLKAYREHDYDEAARQLLDSRYALQVPNRANRNAAMMLTGEIEL